MDSRYLFYLVERIRSDVKYFDVSWDEIERTLRAEGYFDCHGEHECVDVETGEVVSVRLRLNVTAQHRIPETWKIAIKLHETRIDGIDHETSFHLKGKGKGSGWHRHQWNRAARQAESGKAELPTFGRGLSSQRLFLIKAFQELKVQVSKQDHGDDQRLQFD